MSKNKKSFWNIFSKKDKQIEDRSYGYSSYGLSFGMGTSGSYSANKSLLLSAVYRCVNVIGDNIAMLDLIPYTTDSKGYKKPMVNTQLYNVLNCNPNVRMSKFTFIKTVISSVLLEGNAYAYIERDETGFPKAFHYIPSCYVTVIPPQTIVDPLKYTVSGINGEIEAKDMLHFINYSTDGLIGISTIKYATKSLELAANAEASASGFFGGGCAIGGVISINSVMSKEAKENFKKSWEKAFSPDTGNPNGVAILESNMSYTPITVNPTDSQLLETREYNCQDIARWFGVPLNKLFITSNTSYNTLEQSNLSFLSDTLQPLMTKIEEEFERKILMGNCKCAIDVKFSTEMLLKTDKSSLSAWYRELYNIGVLSVNEIRKELNLTPVKGGNSHVSQANLMTIDNIAKNIPSNSAVETIDVDENNEREKISE